MPRFSAAVAASYGGRPVLFDEGELRRMPTAPSFWWMCSQMVRIAGTDRAWRDASR